MAAESGGGAATNSGVRYQNRVAAYLLATALCDQPTQALAGARVEVIGFETTEAVDDLNISTGAESLYLQVKRELSFSLGAATELGKTLDQFVRQHLSGEAGRYVLVTTSESSRRISSDMRVALGAYRMGSHEAFYRDQAKALTVLIDKLREHLVAIANEKGCSDPRGIGEEVLRRMHVAVVDLDENSPLEQATLLILAAKGYLNPALLWTKLISDCLTHSTRRHTASIAAEREKYARFVRSAEFTAPVQAETFLKFEFGSFDFPVGREVLLGTLSEEGEQLGQSGNLVLMEFRRFNDDCEERLQFGGSKCRLKNGIVIDVLRRTATMTGMLRYIERHKEIIQGAELVHFPFDSDEDLQKGLCAEMHRHKLRDAALANQSLLTCLRCGRHVSSLTAEVAELDGASLQVGLIHDECLHPLDRLLGTIQNDFFRDYSFLVNFDVNGWFRAIERGQGAFAAGVHEREEAVMAWGGRKPDFAPGDFLVECMLANGESEYCTERGKIHRLTKLAAEDFAEKLNAWVAKAAKDKDPLCYSDQSRAFSSRSQLTRVLGVKEKLREMIGARTVRYDEAIAKRYEYWSSWYAPLLLLQSTDDGAVVVIGNVVPILTNPLELDRYIDNWRSAGIDLGSYQTTVIYTDSGFDDLMVQAERDGLYVVINPLLDPSDKGGFSRGTLIRSIESLVADRKATPDDPSGR
ncbi:hypothetical protein AB7M16_006591 [Bradyrhizobium sp. USDA 372]